MWLSWNGGIDDFCICILVTKHEFVEIQSSSIWLKSDINFEIGPKTF